MTSAAFTWYKTRDPLAQVVVVSFFHLLQPVLSHDERCELSRLGLSPNRAPHLSTSACLFIYVREISRPLVNVLTEAQYQQ